MLPTNCGMKYSPMLADVPQRPCGYCPGTAGLFLPPSRCLYLNKGFRRLSMNFLMKTYRFQMQKWLRRPVQCPCVRVPGNLSGRQPFLFARISFPRACLSVSSLPLFETEIRSLPLIFEMKTNGFKAGCGAMFPQYVTFRRWA